MMPVSIAPTKRLVGTVGGPSDYMVVVHNCGRDVNLWRPLNYTLPGFGTFI